jgi:hypothetical protein
LYFSYADIEEKVLEACKMVIETSEKEQKFNEIKQQQT